MTPTRCIQCHVVLHNLKTKPLPFLETYMENEKEPGLLSSAFQTLLSNEKSLWFYGVKMPPGVC